LRYFGSHSVSLYAPNIEPRNSFPECKSERFPLLHW
jgi:hypothetical protein